MERKLAAILAADVAGYSRLVAENEETTLRTLGAYREAITDLVAEHSGRIFGQAGDSVIAEFASPVQAVRTAVAIQRALDRHNADLPQNQRLEFRIGINLGDVIADGADLLGDGVNVAARLQEIAAPTGICISGSVREHVDGKLRFPTAHLGERMLKNIPRPIQVYRVDWTLEDPSTTGVLGGPLALPDRPSIAVLPFVNMSGDPEQEYFADGLSEEIITALSRYRWFFVIARNSSFAFKGKAVDVKQIARELGVRYVLEGSVRKSGTRVRVTGQLIDAETGVHLWAERYDRDYEDIFALQDELTEAVVGAIEPEILAGEGRRAVRKPTKNLDAYECCMRGIWHHYQVTHESLEEAIRWQRKAIELDSALGRAHMALARALMSRCLFTGSDDIVRDSAEIVSSAALAAAIDPRDPYSHYVLFLAHLTEHKHDVALADAQRAIDLSPNFAFGHFALGWARNFCGRYDTALGPLLRGLRLSPHDPLAFHFKGQIALAHFQLENYEEAMHFAEQALAFRRLYFVLIVTIACLGMLGRVGEAKLLIAEAIRSQPPDIEHYWSFAFPYADLVDRERLYEGLRNAGMTI